MKFLFAITILFLFTLPAFAKINSTSIDYLQTNSNAYNPDGLWLFFGTNMGLVDLTDSTLLPNRDGHQVNFKFLGSLYKIENRFIADLGLGFQSNYLSGFKQKFTTQSFFTEASARWEFTPQWSVGPVANILVGNKNTFTNNKKTLATFIGATVHYRHPINQYWILKVGARALTDIDVSSRQITKWLLDFQIGFPPSNSPAIISQENTDDSGFNDEAAYTLDENFESTNLEGNDVQMAQPDFDDTDIEFSDSEKEIADIDIDQDKETVSYKTFKSLNGPLVNIKITDIKYDKGKVVPSFKNDQYLERLANVLSENQELFDKVNIKGHAGDFKFDQKIGNTNKIISHSRANDILKKLATNGLPSSKIFSMSFGEYTPNEVDSAKQKVELEFSGVHDEATLRKLINNIKL